MKKYHQLFSFLMLLILTGPSVIGQISQTIRGTIIDKQAESPLIGAAVQVVGITPVLGGIADENGSFEIKNVPTGRHAIQVSFIGYKTMTIPNIVVNAGKETILNLSLEESVTKLDAVTVSSKTEKGQTQNELATISARQFNVEEVQRFSGGRNDVSRLAANFAGVAIANDSRNDIVIRGNSPTGVLWRLEGIPIPNPNHFSTLGTTGGPVSALNPNMIRNSDFLTSAFPSEYGNALAGVFDIGLRNGNKDKYEFTAQLAAFSGFEGMAEGPLSIGSQKGSFVVAYRHSFAEVANKVGLNIGTKALPRYKDLTFNVDFGNGKWGKFSLFGIGGTSTIAFLGKDLGEDDFFADKNADSYADSKLGLIGLRHNIVLDNNTYLRTVISASHNGNKYDEYRDQMSETKRHITDVSDFTTAYRLSSFLNKKFNAKWSMRTGVLLQNQNLNSNTRDRDNKPEWFQVRSFNGAINLLEAYAQTQFKPVDKLTFNAGVHVQYLDLNKKTAVEPRLAVNYTVASGQTLSLGYGLHAQTQPLPIILDEERLPNGTYQKTNQDLDFTRSHHFVLGYDVKVGTNWHAKIETYYQRLNGVPVTSTSSSYSVLNTGADFAFDVFPFLENKGTGDNKGVELTIEKFFSQGWYMLTTASFFDSKYKGSDNIERNTAFNGNYVFNVLSGKEFKFGKTKQNAFTIDTKLTAAGGRPYTPIDLVASKATGREIFKTNEAYSARLSDYFRWDIKIGYTLNSSKRKFTQQFFLDFQNVTNNRNIFQQRFSQSRGEIYNVYQIGFFPDVLWRVQF